MNSHKKTLLYVEDDADLRSAVSHHLSDRFKVVEADSIDQAVDIINDLAKIDVLVTDFKLSKIDQRTGLDVASAFRAKFSTAPIVLATGSVLDATQTNFITHGLSGQICKKPFQGSDILEMIDK